MTARSDAARTPVLSAVCPSMPECSPCVPHLGASLGVSQVATRDASRDRPLTEIFFDSSVGSSRRRREDGVVVFWEQSLSFSEDPLDRDLVAFDAGGIVWEAALPHDMEWASVITVTDNHLIGTASTITESDESLLSLNFPSVTDDYLVLLDRSSGELVWRGELPDDGAATVTIGPDGALYAGVYGLLSMLAIDELPNAGLVRFSPIANE